MLTDSRIVYLFLYVADLGASRAFFEQTLRLRVLEEDEGSVKYDTGEVILALNRAADHGVTLPGEHDHSTDIVFLVDDVDAAVAELHEAGVVTDEVAETDTQRYVHFRAPDGQLYELVQQR